VHTPKVFYTIDPKKSKGDATPQSLQKHSLKYYTKIITHNTVVFVFWFILTEADFPALSTVDLYVDSFDPRSCWKVISSPTVILSNCLREILDSKLWNFSKFSKKFIFCEKFWFSPLEFFLMFFLGFRTRLRQM